MTSVYGLDGCKGGWCAVRLDLGGDDVIVHEPKVLTFADVLRTDAEVIAIDIPIGLLDVPGARGCDIEARKLLGRPRASSVFPAPSRTVLPHCILPGDYVGACDLNERLTERRLTKQSFAIAPKINEVDDLMTPALQHRVREVHPELCFWVLAAHPIRHNKRRPEGRAERWTVLRRLLPTLPPQPELPHDIARLCAMDDYIDAIVAAWTAVCIVRGQATRIPAELRLDARGLRMEMWFPSAIEPMTH